jgi:diguanylate cyclase (GGDEF)-like protein
VARHLRLAVADLEQLLDPAFETEGCDLLPLEEAKRRVPSYADTFRSVSNGRGPAAWNRHWLVVPLTARSGELLGAVFADDPADRLLPTRERLQALRLFANQATSALESSAQFQAMRHLVDRDPLTKLLNRRAFVRHLADAADRGRESGQPLSLVYCDLDGFKAVNDTRGHAAGDRVLRGFGDLLTSAVRAGDEVFRMGGDEFALLVERCPRERAVEVVVDPVRERLRELSGDADLAVATSLGVAVADCCRSTATSCCGAPTTRCTRPRARARVARGGLTQRSSRNVSATSPTRMTSPSRRSAAATHRPLTRVPFAERSSRIRTECGAVTMIAWRRDTALSSSRSSAPHARPTCVTPGCRRSSRCSAPSWTSR